MVAAGRNPRSFGHPGAGGSIGWADPDTRLAVAMTHNRMFRATTPEENPGADNMKLRFPRRAGFGIGCSGSSSFK